MTNDDYLTQQRAPKWTDTVAVLHVSEHLWLRPYNNIKQSLPCRLSVIFFMSTSVTNVPCNLIQYLDFFMFSIGYVHMCVCVCAWTRWMSEVMFVLDWEWWWIVNAEITFELLFLPVFVPASLPYQCVTYILCYM